MTARLSPMQVFSVSRWYQPDRPKETGRMLSLAVAALLDIGVREPQRHLFLASEGRIGILLISRSPLSTSDLNALTEAVTEYGYDIFVSPGGRATKADSDVLQSIVSASSREELERYTSGLALDLTPPTDDPPFFFNQFPLGKPIQAVRLFQEMYGHGGEGGV